MVSNQLPSNKKFGLFFSVIFTLLAFYFNYHANYNLTVVALIITVFFLLAALFFDSVLTPFNNLWMKFGLLLGMIVSPVVMASIFFGLFLPIALIIKIFGRDELRLKMKLRESHWKIREHDLMKRDSFKNQF